MKRIPPRSEHVLVADDDPHCRALLVQLLGELGFLRVSQADSAQRACAILEAEPADYVLTDLAMERELSGVEVVQAARRAAARAAIFSGSAGVEDLARSLGVPFLTKDRLSVMALASLMETLKAP
jgi:CheY-like chemotaxis protein